MVRVEVFLKSGHTVKFRCDECTFQFDKTTGEYTGYKFTGIVGYHIVSFVPAQIAGYTTKTNVIA